MTADDTSKPDADSAAGNETETNEGSASEGGAATTATATADASADASASGPASGESAGESSPDDAEVPTMGEIGVPLWIKVMWVAGVAWMIWYVVTAIQHTPKTW